VNFLASEKERHQNIYNSYLDLLKELGKAWGEEKLSKLAIMTNTLSLVSLLAGQI